MVEEGIGVAEADGEVVAVGEGEGEVVAVEDADGDGDIVTVEDAEGEGVTVGVAVAVPAAKSDDDGPINNSGRLNASPIRMNFRRSTGHCYIIKAVTAITTSSINGIMTLFSESPNGTHRVSDSFES